MKNRLIENTFAKHDSWITQFLIDGETYGGGYPAYMDRRIDKFKALRPDDKRVLELGCLEGGHTVSLADCYDVVAVEGKQGNFDKTKEIIRLHKTKKKIELVHANLEDFDIQSLGFFDSVFCVGLLYHLRYPNRLIHDLSQMSDHLYIWTHCCGSPNAVNVDGQIGRIYEEPNITGPLTGMSTKSFWPTVSELVNMLTECGYARCEILEDVAGEAGDRKVLLSARRS